jgi:glycosyltransferase involved in cell wall biosynthesis
VRIVQLITGAASFGGAQTHVRDLALGLRSHGHDCVVLTGPPEGLFSDQLRALGIPVHFLGSMQKPLHPIKDGLALVELVAVLRQLKPDLVAAHTAKAGFLGRVAAAVLNIPCVFTPHGWSIIDRATGKINPAFRGLERLGGLLGTGVITVCRDEHEIGRASGLISARKLFCVYNGIPDCNLISTPGDDHLTVMMVARFHKQKDHVTLLRAFARLKKYPWRLQLVGSGPLLEVTRDLAKSMGLANRVEFLGECPNTADLLSRATVFVLSTSYEAFPISVLEAMRAGLPIVASKVGGIPEAVSDGESGFLVPPCREDLMAESLERLFLDPFLRERVGQNGRQVFLERFTEKRMILQTLQIYGLLLNRDLRPRLQEVSALSPSTAARSAMDPSI